MPKAFPISVAIIGKGKVGTSLFRALTARGIRVELRAARRGLPRNPIRADLLVLSVRDGQLASLVAALLSARAVQKTTAVVHCAGSLGPEPLAPLRSVSAGVAQMHPMISFASPRFLPTLTRGQVNLDGDPVAVRRAADLARILGMTPRRLPELDKVAYHAAAGLVANGAAALSAAGARLLAGAGVDTKTATKMLGPLLRSVADNVEHLGLPGALTGPVRRGDALAVGRHLEIVRAKAPELVSLYRELVVAQLPMARALADAKPAELDAIERALGQKGAERPKSSRLPARRRRNV